MSIRWRKLQQCIKHPDIDVSTLDAATRTAQGAAVDKAWLMSYVGWALLYAGAGTIALAALTQVSSRKYIVQARKITFVVLFFVALTQHPLPDRATLECPVLYTEPQVIPFDFVRRSIRHWFQAGSWFGWLTRTSSLSVIMNFVLCAVIGGLLARHQEGLTIAVGLGFSLSLAVELTQLTGIWGLYPCAYRQFDVDDLILNTLGVALGFVVAGVLSTRRNRT